jgi:hypothetical protein
VYDNASQSSWVFSESAMFFNSLCIYYMVVFCMYVKLCSIFLFRDSGSVMVYAALCPV